MKYFSLIILAILLVGCSKSNQTEKEYIQNLEEKNRLLEKEISDLKNDSTDMVSTETDNRSKKKTDFFTIGSTEKEVIEIMGNPTSYMDLAHAGKIMHFEMSSVTFENGRVKSYSNLDDNLKVKITE